MTTAGWPDLAVQLGSNPDSSFGSGATEQEIAAAERLLGVSIRGDYREFLRRFGWGGVGDIELFGLGRDVPKYLDLAVLAASERDEMNPPLPHHLLPVMNDGGGNLYCIDTIRADEMPTVVLWRHDEPITQKPTHQANDFTSWLKALLEERDLLGSS